MQEDKKNSQNSLRKIRNYIYLSHNSGKNYQLSRKKQETGEHIGILDQKHIGILDYEHNNIYHQFNQLFQRQWTLENPFSQRPTIQMVRYYLSNLTHPDFSTRYYSLLFINKYAPRFFDYTIRNENVDILHTQINQLKVTRALLNILNNSQFLVFQTEAVKIFHNYFKTVHQIDEVLFTEFIDSLFTNFKPVESSLLEQIAECLSQLFQFSETNNRMLEALVKRQVPARIATLIKSMVKKISNIFLENLEYGLVSYFHLLWEDDSNVIFTSRRITFGRDSRKLQTILKGTVFIENIKNDLWQVYEIDLPTVKDDMSEVNFEIIEDD